MEFEIIGRHVEVTDPVRDYLTERRDKLAKFFDRIHSLKIVIAAEGANHTAEFIAHLVKGEMVVAKGAAPDLFTAIEQCADKMEQQLRRFKDRLREHRTKPGETTLPAAQPAPAEESEEPPSIEEIE